MYGNSRRMLVFLVESLQARLTLFMKIFLTLTEAVTLGVIFGMPRKELIGAFILLTGEKRD
jgi:hypothetical protein